MKGKTVIFLAVAITMATFSCTKQDREVTIVNQETSIDSYLSNQFPDSTIIRRNGSNKVILTLSNAKDSLEFGDSLYFYYGGFIFSNGPGTLFDTNWEALAQRYNYSLTDPDFSMKKVRYDSGSFIPGLTDGLYGVREVEQCIIVFSARYGFNNTRVYNIPKLSPLLYQVLIEKVIKEQ